MNNPLHILQTLDLHLTAAAEITIFGRAALVLGYADCPANFATTNDVDAILPLKWLDAPDENLDFWQAQQKTNAELEPSGLYLTHLFREQEIILSLDWISKRVRISLEQRHLIVFRPSTLDLILTKMMRGDENDLTDIRFLLEREPQSEDSLRNAFGCARIPDLQEIRDLFQAAQPKVLEMAHNHK